MSADMPRFRRSYAIGTRMDRLPYVYAMNGYSEYEDHE
jgi:hypothetical protein